MLWHYGELVGCPGSGYLLLLAAEPREFGRVNDQGTIFQDVFLSCPVRSWWSHVELGPPDAIFGLVEAFQKDPRPEKVSLAIGAYRDGNNKPFVLPTVKKVKVL